MNYYKRHIGDYATDASHLSLTEHGAYTVLMDRYYRVEEAPTRAEALRWTRARSDEEVAAVDAVLAEFFVFDGERHRQSRIDRELDAFHVKQEANRALGARGGVANGKRNAKRNASETLPKQEANDKPSHKPLAISHKEAKAKPAPKGDDLLIEIPPQLAQDFRALRAKLRAPITETALNGIRREAGKAGLSFEQAITACCERGWRGFKAEWMNDSPSGFSPPAIARNPTGSSPVITGAEAKRREREALAAMARQYSELVP